MARYTLKEVIPGLLATAKISHSEENNEYRVTVTYQHHQKGKLPFAEAYESDFAAAGDTARALLEQHTRNFSRLANEMVKLETQDFVCFDGRTRAVRFYYENNTHIAVCEPSVSEFALQLQHAKPTALCAALVRILCVGI